MSRTALSVPRWAVITTFVLSLVGLGLSIDLTVAHFVGTQILACSETGLFNCARVTTSGESRFLGIPVVFLGLGNFLAMCGLNSPWGWRSKHYWLHVARFVLAIVAMIFVLWLFSAELLIVKNFCYYCTGVHIVTFALLVVLSLVSPTQLGWSKSAAH